MSDDPRPGHENDLPAGPDQPRRTIIQQPPKEGVPASGDEDDE